jgi:hypothetical protein
MQTPRNDPPSLPAVERRCGGERRQGDDRRELIRYEPQHELRRKNRDRRAHHGWDDLPLR